MAEPVRSLQAASRSVCVCVGGGRLHEVGRKTLSGASAAPRAVPSSLAPWVAPPRIRLPGLALPRRLHGGGEGAGGCCCLQDCSE